VKSFVYLDEYKMYSMSSQLMEGVTEYILQESRETASAEGHQSGPFLSGRKIGEIVANASSNIEKKFLHDYAYSIFESKLTELDKLFFATSDTDIESFIASGKKMIRVRARVQFLDAAEIAKVMGSLVDMQDAILVVSRNDEREQVIQEILKLEDPTSKSGRAGILRKQLAVLSEPEKAKLESENERANYASLAGLISTHLKDRLDVLMSAGDFLVKADMKRDCLRNEENFIYKTYSRFSDVELVLVGIVTQANRASKSETSILPSENEESESDGFRNMIMRAVECFQQLDSLFTDGKGSELVVDPIALYLEID